MSRLRRAYEGPEVLAELLVSSACALTVEEVVEEFACALEEGSAASEVIPLLWELEPTFAGAGQAERTFANLLGLWDQLASGPDPELPVLDLAAEAGRPSAPVVERLSAALEGLPAPELRRARDRYENAPLPQIIERALDQTVASQAQALAHDLAFECWWIWQQTEPAPIRRPLDPERCLALADNPALDEPQPGLANLVTATLWERAAGISQLGEESLPELDIPPLERALRALRHALSAAR